MYLRRFVLAPTNLRDGQPYVVTAKFYNSDGKLVRSELNLTAEDAAGQGLVFTPPFEVGRVVLDGDFVSAETEEQPILQAEFYATGYRIPLMLRAEAYQAQTQPTPVSNVEFPFRAEYTAPQYLAPLLQPPLPATGSWSVTVGDGRAV